MQEPLFLADVICEQPHIQCSGPMHALYDADIRSPILKLWKNTKLGYNRNMNCIRRQLHILSTGSPLSCFPSCTPRKPEPDYQTNLQTRPLGHLSSDQRRPSAILAKKQQQKIPIWSTGSPRSCFPSCTPSKPDHLDIRALVRGDHLQLCLEFEQRNDSIFLGTEFTTPQNSFADNMFIFLFFPIMVGYISWTLE